MLDRVVDGRLLTLASQKSAATVEPCGSATGGEGSQLVVFVVALCGLCVKG